MANDTHTYHRMKVGESLSDIAKKYHISLDQLYKLNLDLKKGVDESSLVGKTLRVSTGTLRISKMVSVPDVISVCPHSGMLLKKVGGFKKVRLKIKTDSRGKAKLGRPNYTNVVYADATDVNIPHVAMLRTGLPFNGHQPYARHSSNGRSSVMFNQPVTELIGQSLFQARPSLSDSPYHVDRTRRANEEYGNYLYWKDKWFIGNYMSQLHLAAHYNILIGYDFGRTLKMGLGPSIEIGGYVGGARSLLTSDFIFSANGGYGLFGKEKLILRNYEIEALYGYGDGVSGGTYFSVRKLENGLRKKEGALFRLDFGKHTGIKDYLHVHARFYIKGRKVGGTKPWPK